MCQVPAGQKIQLNQPIKGQTMAKRKAVKVNDQAVTDLMQADCQQSIDRMTIEQLKKAVGTEIFEAAQQQAGAAATVADIEAVLARMLT